MIANALLSAVFVFFWAHTGLALATSIAALFNAILLGLGLYRRQIFVLQPGWAIFLLRLAFASLMMSGLIFYFSPPLESWFGFKILERVLTLLALIVGSSIVYLASLWITGLRPRHVLVGE